MEFNREAFTAVFLAEATEGLQDMEQSLLAVEANPDDSEALGRVFRTAHTLKGNASAMGFDSLSAFAHVIEDLLEVLRKRYLAVTPGTISLLLRSVDALRKEVSAACQGSSAVTEEHQVLRQEIELHAGKAKVANADVKPALSATIRTAVEPQNRTLRIDVSKLDQMLDLSGEIAIVQGHMERLLSGLPGEVASESVEVLREMEGLFKQLQELVMEARLVPIGPLFQQLLRPVREISRDLGKMARLDIFGAEVEVDTRVYELLKDPLMHMVRNAIDHGVESPDVRQNAGKSRCAILTLTAVHRAGTIVIRLTDDGAGFDKQKILAAARSAGLISENERLSDVEIFRLCFSAGLTTSPRVTELSGRGVGMDVVRRNIDALRGKIEIESTPGEGAAITITLPLTLAIIEGFAVRAGGETYIIPLEMVGECMELSADASRTESGGVLNLRGEALPYIRLSHALGLADTPRGHESIVVLHSDNGLAGLAVDALLGESQAIIKPLGRLFQDVPGISGSTILADGRVALILDVNALLHEAGLAQHRGRQSSNSVDLGRKQ